MTSTADNKDYGVNDDLQQPLSSAVLPLAGSLVFTGAAVLAICGLPRANSLTWAGVSDTPSAMSSSRSLPTPSPCGQSAAAFAPSSTPPPVRSSSASGWRSHGFLSFGSSCRSTPPGRRSSTPHRWPRCPLSPPLLGSTESVEDTPPKGLFEIKEEPSLLSVVAAPGLSAIASSWESSSSSSANPLPQASSWPPERSTLYGAFR